MSVSEPMAYAGTCETCGALCAAAVDTPDHKRGTAKFVAGMLRDGLRVERVTCEHVRQNLKSCYCKRGKAKRASAVQELLPIPTAAPQRAVG